MKILTIFVCILSVGFAISSVSGPIFVTRHESSVEFLNTEGAMLDCVAYGDPDPQINWYKSLPDGRREKITAIPSIRQTYSNGSMVLKRFTPDRYSSDVHATTYRCGASNVQGRIISVPISVRAVTDKRMQQVQVQVYDEYVIQGNTAVLRCHIPSFFKDDLEVTAWVREDNHVIDRNGQSDKRYTVTDIGNLHIRNMTSAVYRQMGYCCQVKNRLSGEIFLSQTAGKIKLTEPQGTVLPIITDILQNVYVQKGKSVELPCAAQGNPPPNYRWTQPDGRSVSGTEGLLTVTDTETTGSFVYTCSVQNSNGEDSKDTLLVITEQLSAHITQESDDNGHRIVLTCHASGYPIKSVEWIFNGDRVDSLTNNENSFTIYNAGLKDRGMYQCLVSNEWDVVQATIQLQLGDYAPSFLKTFKGRILQPGPSIELECSGTGHPKPTMEWLRNGERIVEDENVQIKGTFNKEGTVESKLIVRNIRVLDGGQYICKISNKLGNDVHSKRIDVYGLPIVHQMKNVTTSQGRTVFINCYVSGYPIQNIVWSRANRTSYLPRGSATWKNGTLMIKDIERKHQGMYSCTATNGRGQTDAKLVTVKVLRKPNIYVLTPQESLPEGDTVSITCTVTQGDDPIKITWKKDGRNLKYVKGIDITSTKLYSLIQIRTLNSSHRGNYTCIAENPAGAVKKTVALTISVAPKWKHEPMDTTENLGKDIKLLCKGVGYPTPSSEWLKVIDSTTLKPIDDSNSKFRLEEDNSILVIKKISKKQDDGTRYRCIVTNGVMPDLVKEITIKVITDKIETPPKYSSAYFGTRWELNCENTGGHKEARMLWTKGSRQLTNFYSKRVKLRRGRNTLRLIIDPLKFQDEGRYTCQMFSGNKLTGQTETRLKVLPGPDIEMKNNFSSSETLKFSSTIAKTPLPTTKIMSIREEGYATTKEDLKQRDSSRNSEINLIESEIRRNENDIPRDSGSKSKMKRHEQNSKNIKQIIIFVVPAAVVIILLIAVISTIIAYLVIRRSAKRDRLAGLQRCYRSNPRLDDNFNGKNSFNGNSSKDVIDDRQYGRLKSSKYNDVKQNTYEIPDYCGGVKPYSTLQIRNNSNRFTDTNRDSQCSI